MQISFGFYPSQCITRPFRRLVRPAALVVWCLLSTVALAGGTADEPDEVLVKFRDGASGLDVQQALGTRPGQRQVTDRLWKAGIRPGETVEQVIIELESLPEVEYAEPNFTRRIQRVPDESLFDEQWALLNFGQELPADAADGVTDFDIGSGFDIPEVRAGTLGADIGAETAWNVTTGNRDIIVAVIDTGVDLSHLDLVDNLLRDINGDVIGQDFITPNTAPEDPHGHGTAMAGIIGALGDNGIGIAGVAWEVTLMPLRALDDDGGAGVDTVIDAINFAVKNGAHIINASFGSRGRGPSDAEFEAIQAAGEKDVLLVAAACNQGADNDQVLEADSQEDPCYPASYDLPNIISVAATDNNDALAGFSNYGLTSVDLGAPGVHILSLTPDGAESYHSGTSASAALVSGAAALLLSQDPTLSPTELRERLMATADPASNLDGQVVSGGRLNVATALGAEPSADSQAGGGGGGGGGHLTPLTLAALLAALALPRARRWKSRR